MKRIIVLLCAISVLVCGLVIPVAAASDLDSGISSSNQDSIIDLLTAREYWAGADNTWLDYSTTSPASYCNGTNNFMFNWVTDSVKANGLFIGIRSTKTPSQLYYKPFSSAGYNSTTLVSHSGNLWFFYADYNGSIADLTIKVTYSAPYYGNIGVVYAYTQAQNVINFDSLGCHIYPDLKSNIPLVSQTVSVPYSYVYESASSGYFMVLVNVSPDHDELLLADSYTLIFSSTGWCSGVNGTVYDSSGNIVTVLDGHFNGGYGVATSTLYTDKYTHYIYKCTFDTSGIDLRDCYIRFKFAIEPNRISSSASLGYGAYFAINSCSAKIPVFETPWYARLYSWFSDLFNNLNTNINYKFYNLENYLTEKFDAVISTINSALGTNAESPDISDQQQQIEQGVDGMDQIGDEIEGSREELDELMPEMPSWEQTGLDGFDDIVGSFIQEIRAFFLAIYDNAIINQILTYTFLFALGGFILFGERM